MPAETGNPISAQFARIAQRAAADPGHLDSILTISRGTTAGSRGIPADVGPLTEALASLLYDESAAIPAGRPRRLGETGSVLSDVTTPAHTRAGTHRFHTEFADLRPLQRRRPRSHYLWSPAGPGRALRIHVDPEYSYSRELLVESGWREWPDPPETVSVAGNVLELRLPEVTSEAERAGSYLSPAGALGARFPEGLLVYVPDNAPDRVELRERLTREGWSLCPGVEEVSPGLPPLPESYIPFGPYPGYPDTRGTSRTPTHNCACRSCTAARAQIRELYAPYENTECRRCCEISDSYDSWGHCTTCARVCTGCGIEAESTDLYGRCRRCSVRCGGCGNPCEARDFTGRGSCCEVRCPSCNGRCYSVYTNPDGTRIGDCCLPECEGCEARCLPGELINGICAGCDEESIGDDILPYNRRFPFQKVGKGPMYFGIELEVEVNSGLSVRELVPCRPSGWILKRDGSLDNGAEFVSPPTDIESWREFDFSWAKDIPGRAYDTETCGMHIHVSRDAVRPIVWAKIEKWMQKDTPFWVRVSRRKNTGAMTRWAKIFAQSAARKARKDNISANDDRYQALNMTRKTAEFRIFRGTINADAVLRNIELIHAAIRYAETASYQNIGTEGFLTWLNSKDAVKTIGRKAANSLRGWDRCASS